MEHRWYLVIGIALLVVGILGVTAVVFLVPGATGLLPSFTSNGERIYYTGEGAQGPIPRLAPGTGMMLGTLGCVDCHGADGRGGTVETMMGTYQAPDIRYSALTSTRSEDESPSAPWTAASIATAIRDGVEPSGRQLAAPMPRWQMNDRDMSDLIAYLKELSAR